MTNYFSLDILKEKKSVCLISHIAPDADALSSMIVLKEFLQQQFKISTVDLFAEVKDDLIFYKDILENTTINNNPKDYEVAIMLDSPNIERLGIFKDIFICAPFKIVIDHHATNDYSGDINIVEFCSSTCEIIYSVLNSYNFKISNQNQGKLYAGIITDTNNFSVGNYNSRTFKIASQIVENINKDEIYNHFLANNTLNQMKLFSKAIKNIFVSNNKQIIISYVDHKDIDEIRASQNDCSGIVNKLATISGSKLVCFIYPINNNTYYVSLRAKNGYDVSEIAKSHSGGGHTGAAAFLSKLNIDEIKTSILDALKKELNNNYIKTSKMF